MVTIIKIIILLLALVGLLSIFFIAWVLTLKEDEPLYKKRRTRYQFTNLTPEQWEKLLN